MRSSAPRVLYFTKGAVPSLNDVETAEKISHNVGFRNGSLKTGDRPEPCDAVAGPMVPPMYIDAGIPLVTSRTTLDAAMKARTEAAKPKPSRPARMAKPEPDDDEIEEPEIEYLLNADGSPVIIDGSMVQKGTPQADAYLEELHQAKLGAASEDFKKGHDDGFAKVEYKPEEVTDEYKLGYEYGLSRITVSDDEAATAAEAAENPKPAKKAGKKAAKKAPAKKAGAKPASTPGWGK